MQSGVAPDRPGADPHDLLHPEIVPDPVRGIVGVVDEERPAPYIGIAETPDEDGRGTALVAACRFCRNLRMKAAHNGAAGKTAHPFSLTFGTLHHGDTSRTPVAIETRSVTAGPWITTTPRW